MGSNNKDKWLGKLKDSVQNFSEPLPDNFWEEIQKDIPAAAVPQHRRSGWKLVWTIPAAAAVVLLAAFLFSPHEGGTIMEPVAEVGEQLIGASMGGGKSEPVQPVLQKGHAVNAAADNVAAGNVAVAENVVAENVVAEVEKAVAEADKADLDGAGETVGSTDGETTAESEGAVPEKEVVEERETRRKEYLKELEYLQQNGSSKEREKGRKWLALAAGNSGMQFDGGIFMDKSPYQNPGSSVVGSTASTVPPEVQNSLANETYIAGLLNLNNKYGSSPQWLGTNSPEIFTSKFCPYDHDFPVKLGVMFAWQLRSNIYMESGISYQFLKSELKDTRSLLQKLHYLGIPLRLTAKFVDSRVFSAYISGGYLLEKCVYGELDGQKLTIPGLQNSVNVHIGAQLNIAGGAALYIEPGLYRYLGMRNDVLCEQNGYRIKHIYSEDPGGFSFQGGLRFSF